MKLQIKQREHSRFYCLLTLLLLLICIRYALQIDIPKIVFLVIIAIIAITGDKNEIIAMCLCCIPLHESVDFFYAQVICTGSLMLKCYKTIHIGIVVPCSLLLVLWELLHCFDPSFSVVELLTDIIPLLVLTVIISTDISDLDYDFVVRALAYATLFTCCMLLSWFVYQYDFDFVRAFANLQRLGLNETESKKNTLVTGGQVHPNSLGIICVLVSAGLMQIRSVGRGRVQDLITVCALLLFGTLTSSRTFLASLTLMILLLVLAQKGSIQRKIRFLGLIVLVLLLALVLLQVVFPELLEYFFGRFTVKDITTGRMRLMTLYHRFIVSNIKVMLFGIGLHEFGDKVTDVYRVAENVPHNGIQEIVIAWGIPGVILFALLWIFALQKSKKYAKRHCLLNYVPFLIILFKMQAGQALTSAYTMLSLSYAYLSLSQNFYGKDRN